MSFDPKHVSGVITDPDRANEVLLYLYTCAADRHCHVARGRVRIATILPGFAFACHVVYPSQDDITDMRGKGLIYKSSFVQSLSATAGLRVAATTRCDDGRDPLLREYECTMTGLDLAFRNRTWVGRYELDLRDGSPRADKIMAIKMGRYDKTQEERDEKNLKQLREKREHLAQIAATGAFCRAVVEALAISRNFKDQGMSTLPIVIPSMELHVASAPAAIQEQLALGAMQAVLGAFGPPVQQVAPALPAAPAELPPPPADNGFQPYDDHDDDVPFSDGDGVPYDDEAPPAEPPLDDMQQTDRPCEAGEIKHLESLGAYRQSVLRECGWTGSGPVMLSTYTCAVAKFGGAS